MRDFNGVILFPSKISPRNVTRVRKNCDLSWAAFMFSLNKIRRYFFNTSNFSSFTCDCMKTSSNYVMTFLLRVNGQNILLMNAKKAAGPMEIS